MTDGWLPSHLHRPRLTVGDTHTFVDGFIYQRRRWLMHSRTHTYARLMLMDGLYT